MWPSGTTAYEAAFEHLTGAIAAGELLGRTARSSAEIADLHRRRAWLARFADARRRWRTAILRLRSMPLARLATARSRCRSSTGSGCAGTCSTPSARSPATSSRSRSPRSSTTAAGQVSALNRLSLVLRQRAGLRARELGERALELAGSHGETRCADAGDGQPQVRRASTRGHRVARGADSPSSSDPGEPAIRRGFSSGRCASPPMFRWSAATGRRPSGVSRRRSPSASASAIPTAEC